MKEPNQPNIPPAADMEYAKLWMEQSKLMWSRVQFIHLLHASVLGGWLLLNRFGYSPALQISSLSLGIILSKYLLIIINRDGLYMDKLRDFACGAIPIVDKDRERVNGRKSAERIINILCSVETILIIGIIFLYFFPDFLNIKQIFQSYKC